MQKADPNFEDLPNRGFPWLRFFVVFGVLAALAFSIWYFSSKYRADLSRRMLAVSQQYLEEGRKNDAILCLRSAVRLDPGNLIAWHKLATMAAEQQNYASALNVYLKMFQAAAERGLSGQLPSIFSSKQDQRTLMLVALHRDDQQLLKSAADGLGRLAGNMALSRLMLADCYSTSGNMTRAIKELAGMPEDGSIFTNPWKFSDFLEGKKSSHLDSDGYFDILSETASRLGDFGYEVFFFGLKNSLVPLNKVIPVASVLAENSNAPMHMRIFASRFAGAMGGAEVPLEALYPENTQILKIDDRVLLCREFLRRGEPSKVFSLINRAKAIQSNEAFKIWVQASFATNRKEDAFKALDHPANPLSSKETAFELFKLLKKNGQDDAARRLLAALSIDPENEENERILFAGFYAETGQMGALAKLIQAIPEKSPEREALTQSTLSGARHRGDLQAAVTLESARLVAFKPATPADIFADREIFIQLAGGSPDLAGLETMLRTKPDSTPLRISCAFAMLASGRSKDALELLRERAGQIDILSLETHQKVALGLVLAANNLNGPASEIARIAIAETTFPTELEKLGSGLRPLSINSGTEPK